MSLGRVEVRQTISRIMVFQRSLRMTDERDDWDKHWSEYADSAADNPAQRYRRGLVLKLLGIRGDGAGARILDIGSGVGDLAAAVTRRLPKANVAGLELSRRAVEIAARKVPGARFCQADLLRDAAVPGALRGWATHAVCSEVLEHLDEPSKLLENVRGYLAPDCRLVVTVPGGPMSAFDKFIGHRRHYSTGDLGRLLSSAGYRIERTAAAGFPFFNLYRAVVILRGKRLPRDVAAAPGRSYSLLARLTMRIFGIVFLANVSRSPWGWQTAAVALPRANPEPRATGT
jgi:SAM-dependent methyltransferase